MANGANTLTDVSTHGHTNKRPGGLRRPARASTQDREGAGRSGVLPCRARATCSSDPCSRFTGRMATLRSADDNSTWGLCRMTRFRIGVLALTALSVVLVWALPAGASSTQDERRRPSRSPRARRRSSGSSSRRLKVPHGIVTFTVKNVGSVPPRLQDRRQEDEAAQHGPVGEADGHVRQGRQVQVRLHRPEPRDARHVGQPDGHVVPQAPSSLAGRPLPSGPARSFLGLAVRQRGLQLSAAAVE